MLGCGERFVVIVVGDDDADYHESRDGEEGEHSRVSLETFPKVSCSGFVHFIDKPSLRVPFGLNPNATVYRIELSAEHQLVC